MKILNYYPINQTFCNSYFILFKNNETILIDPGDDSGNLDKFIKEKQLIIKYVVLTHGHFDHIANLNKIIKDFNPKIYISSNEIKSLFDEKYNLSTYWYKKFVVNQKCDIFEVKGDIDLKINGISLRFLQTPYHTDGSMCLLVENQYLFSGDSLFKNGVGRSDFINSVPKLMNSSLSKILALNDQIRVFCGHGPTTTIYDERRNY